MKRLLVILTGVMVLAGTSLAQGSRHPYSVDDWASLHGASPVAVSQDGTILYTVGYGAQAGNGSEEWNLMRSDGSNKRRIELPEGFRPSGFTKDGSSLYGTYTVNKLPQLAIFALANLSKTTTPSAMVFLPSGVASVSLSPDGSRFAMLANPRAPDVISEVHTVIEPDQTSLYVVNVDGSGGKWWAPRLTNIGSIAWAADGKSIAVLSSTPKIGFHYVKSQIDVATESGTRRVIEIDNAVAGLAWADGGKNLAFLSTTTSVLTPDHVWTVPAAGGTPVDRTPKLPGSAMNLNGDARGNVWVEIHNGVETEIDLYANGTLKPAYSHAGGYVSLPATCELAAGPASFAFADMDPQHMPNVAVLSDGKVKRLTTEGDAEVARIELGPVKVISWTSKEGIHLEGIATFPAGFGEGRKYPFIVYPHGGPEGNDILGIDSFSRVFASLGYVVIQPEYRGSTGYGSAFLDAIYQHFGDRAYRDVDSATDYAIAQGWADPNRLAIMGWSAGGFMTSWTITQTDRYKAAIEGAGITDWASFMWTSDVQQIDYDARWPGKEPEPFRMFSAVVFADKVTTPLLILHGAADLRVPTFQGREYFEALVDNGKTARMVTYPGSGHFPRLWEQRRDLIKEMTAWLKLYNS